MSEPVRQWIREAQLIVGKGGTGLLIEELRIQFEIEKTVDSPPNKAIIKVFNLNQENESKVRKEYTDVLLNAGYQGAMKQIYSGNVTHVYRYRERTDWITEIVCGDGDNFYRNSFVSETLEAGTDNKDTVSRVLDSAKKMGVELVQGHTVIKGDQRTRGKVMVGNSRDILKNVADQSGANWSIQDGVLQIVPATGMLPNEAIVVDSSTGMLGAPEVNEKGITVKFLMNPEARVNGALKLDNNNMKMKGKKVGETSKGNQLTGEYVQSSGFQDGAPTRIDPDGIYKIIKLTHKGDTRGKDWLTEALCVALEG